MRGIFHYINSYILLIDYMMSLLLHGGTQEPY